MMSNDILEYKGYWTKVFYSSEDKVLYGKIEGINDLINFESDDAKMIEKEFHLAVDDYLEFCKENDVKAEKAYKGTFNVRMSPDLHKRISLECLKRGMNLNQYVCAAVEAFCRKEPQYRVNLSFVNCFQQSVSMDMQNKEIWKDSKAPIHNYKEVGNLISVAQ